MKFIGGIIRACWVCLLFVETTGALQGQGQVDTATIRNWVDSAWNIRFDNPALARLLAQKAFEASGESYYFGKMNSLQLIAEDCYNAGKLDSAIYFYSLALQLSQAQRDLKEDGNNYTALASIYMGSGERDSSLYYYQLALNTFEQLRDSSGLCDCWIRYGSVHNTMGHHARAIEAYMTSLRICEAIGRTSHIAYNYGALAIVHDKQGNEKAEEYNLKALVEFRKSDDLYGQMGVHNNLGIMYKNRKEYSKALDQYTQTLLLADSIPYDQGRLSAHTNLGILNVQMGFLENALHHSAIGLQLARTFQQKEAISDNLNWIARAQAGLKDYEHALENAQEALAVGQEVRSLEKQRDAQLTLSEIYESLKAFDQSLKSYKEYAILKDTILNAEKSKQISELQTIYETDKNDAEIQLLAKNAELDEMRKTRLWVALGLSVLSGILLVYSQWISRTRDKQILSKEKELEVQQRRTVELEKDKMSRELDFKKQELAAKALQLARKNEFLQSLQVDVDLLRSQTEGHVADTTRKISRRIMVDIESEEDWDQFLSSFKEVHHDFVEMLHQAIPDISPGEIRLACLMKMNLSTKEQAALLNVTSDGIKKARYRLRKKMDLDSEIDLQQYFIGFST